MQRHWQPTRRQSGRGEIFAWLFRDHDLCASNIRVWQVCVQVHDAHRPLLVLGEWWKGMPTVGEIRNPEKTRGFLNRRSDTLGAVVALTGTTGDESAYYQWRLNFTRSGGGEDKPSFLSGIPFQQHRDCPCSHNVPVECSLERWH